MLSTIFDSYTFEEYIYLHDSMDPFIAGEDWVPVSRLPELYEVSILGRFRAKIDIIYSISSRFGKKGDIKHRKGEIISQSFHEYYYVCLYDPRCRSKDNSCSNIQSHILISESFENVINDGLVTDHINSNKQDNRIFNLQRISHVENCKKTYDANEHGRWSRRKSSIVCIETNQYYDSLKSAVDAGCGSDSELISAIHTGGCCRGFHYRYYDEDKQRRIVSSRPTVKRKDEPRRRTNLSYIVRCIETGEIMKCSDFGRKFGCTTDSIYHAIDYNKGYSRKLNKTFEIVNNI